MYDELVERLRAESYTLEELSIILPRAADAIEELQKALDAVTDAHNEGYDVGYWAGRRDYEPKWIPVTERLPSEYNRYLTVSIEPWFGTTIVDILRWSGVWMLDGRQTEATVTHWMPLPPPYKGERKDDEEQV